LTVLTQSGGNSNQTTSEKNNSGGGSGGTSGNNSNDKSSNSGGMSKGAPAKLYVVKCSAKGGKTWVARGANPKCPKGYKQVSKTLAK